MQFFHQDVNHGVCLILGGNMHFYIFKIFKF
ncbi:hypothetical protein DFAR_3360018 [Desulfarculales bacterium]